VADHAGMPIIDLLNERIAAFDHFVRGGDHPCVMARSVLTRRSVRFGMYGVLGDAAGAPRLCEDLYAALRAQAMTPGNSSFVAFFDMPRVAEGAAEADEEARFERALWRELQALHEYDGQLHDWDPEVTPDPGDPKFSFSIGGRAWYVIGLHPGASRPARRFSSTALVFNPHEQFERLREQGRYSRVQSSIRERDVVAHGSINPMLADHGRASEARQYSGRAVPDDWQCPFRLRSDAVQLQ
jgi:uncharacterized protein